MRTIHRDIVGTFIFSNDNHLLLGKSRKGGAYEGQWIVPGGGIEEGETKLEAVRRKTMEELGIDISGHDVKLHDHVLTGETEKVLKDTNERVLADMTFYNFVIGINQPAGQIVFTCEDDFIDAKWHSITELS